VLIAQLPLDSHMASASQVLVATDELDPPPELPEPLDPLDPLEPVLTGLELRYAVEIQRWVPSMLTWL